MPDSRLQCLSSVLFPNAQLKAKKTVLQLTYYRRTKEAELFRYNPNYPDPGLRTVILRGKE